MNPFVTMSILMFVESVERTNPKVAIIEPAMQTGRHPNLLTRALATGAEKTNKQTDAEVKLH